MSEYQDHSPRVKEGPMMKLKERGEKFTLRIVTLPYREPKIWRIEGGPPTSTEEMLKYSEQDWMDVYRDPDLNVTETYYWPCIDRDTGKARIFQGTPGIFNQLKGLDADESWGDPRTYDVRIERTEDPGKNYYKVTALPNKTPVTAKELELLKGLNLGELIPAARKIATKQIDYMGDVDDTSEDPGYSKFKAAGQALKDEEVVIEDIGDDPINLDDIPF